MPREDLAYWDVRVDDWIVEGGEYQIEVGTSSRDLRSRTSVLVAGDVVDIPLTMSSSIDEVLAHPKAGPALRGAMGDKFDEHFLRMIGPNPVGRLDGLPLPLAEMEKLIADALA